MNGVVNLLKPPGVSSSGAVVFVRRLLGEKKAGHTGTLDPGAAGVLAICVGRATKLCGLLMAGEKEYVAEIAFGVRTDTQDSYGRVLERAASRVALGDLLRVLPRFTGEIVQVTPAFSAAKLDGLPLYKRARRGEDVRGKQRTVRIHALEAVAQTAADRFLLRVVCGSGTYVRTLCEDIGCALETPAHMSLLIRTQTAGLRIESSLTFDELERLVAQDTRESAVIPAEEILTRYEALSMPVSARERLLNGNAVRDGALSGTRDGAYRVYCGGFLGLGTVSGGAVKMDVRLAGDEH